MRYLIKPISATLTQLFPTKYCKNPKDQLNLIWPCVTLTMTFKVTRSHALISPCKSLKFEYNLDFWPWVTPADDPQGHFRFDRKWFYSTRHGRYTSRIFHLRNAEPSNKGTYAQCWSHVKSENYSKSSRSGVLYRFGKIRQKLGEAPTPQIFDAP